MLTTGTVARSGELSTARPRGRCGGRSRRTWRDSTSAVSRDRLPARTSAARRRAAPSDGRRARRRRPRTTCACASTASGRSARRSALQRPRRVRRRLQPGGAVEQRVEPVARQLGAGEEVRVIGDGHLTSGRALTWNLYHGRSPTPPGADAAERVRARARGLGVGRGAAAGGAAVVAAGAGRRGGRRARRVLTSRNLALCAAAGDLAPRPGHPQGQRRRGERDPRAREHRRAPLRCCSRLARAARRARRAARATAPGSSTCTRPRMSTRPRRRGHAAGAARAARVWAAGAPLLFGGDLNLRRAAATGLRARRRPRRRPPVHRGAPGAGGGGARARAAVRPRAAARHPLRPNPRSSSIARSPAVPGRGTTPRATAAA